MSVLGKDTVYVSEFVDIIGPKMNMIGPVKNGCIIVAHTEPACYGPMITPEIRSGYTVTRPSKCRLHLYIDSYDPLGTISYSSPRKRTIRLVRCR